MGISHCERIYSEKNPESDPTIFFGWAFPIVEGLTLYLQKNPESDPNIFAGWVFPTRKKIYGATPLYLLSSSFILACIYKTASLVANDTQNYQPLKCFSDGMVYGYMKDG
jgi:hypothetical protein